MLSLGLQAQQAMPDSADGYIWDNGSWVHDFSEVYTYDGAGRILVTEAKKLNGQPTMKVTNTYNSNGLITSTTSEMYYLQVFVKTEWTYNSHGHRTGSKEYDYQSQQWQLTEQDSVYHAYDGQNRLISSSYFRFFQGIASPWTKRVYSDFDGNDHPRTIRHQVWNGSAYNDDTKQAFLTWHRGFDPENPEPTSYFYLRNKAGVWEDNKYDSTVLNGSNRVHRYTFDMSGGSLDSFVRIDYEYDAEGYNYKLLIHMYTGGWSAQVGTLDSLVYDASGRIDERISGSYNPTYQWENTYRRVYHYSPMGLDLPQDAGMKLYPNPAVDAIIIELPGAFSDLKVEIFDVRGNQVRMDETRAGNSYNIAHLAPGLYIIRASRGSTSYTARFAKITSRNE